MKTFIFDVDDTLYDLSQPFIKAYEQHLSKYNLDVQELFKTSRHYSDAIFPKVMSGEMSVDECGAYRIKRALEDYNIFISQKEALEFQYTYRYNQGHITLSETMKEVLTYLKGKVQLGIYTNGVSEHQWKKIDGMQLIQYFEKENMFISGDIGYAKPDVRGYKYIEEKMHIEDLEETYFVGDSISMDMAGAKESGWNMIYINRRNHDLSQSKYQPDYYVESEEALLELLKSLVQ